MTYERLRVGGRGGIHVFFSLVTSCVWFGWV